MNVSELILGVNYRHSPAAISVTSQAADLSKVYAKVAQFQPTGLFKIVMAMGMFFPGIIGGLTVDFCLLILLKCLIPPHALIKTRVLACFP